MVFSSVEACVMNDVIFVLSPARPSWSKLHQPLHLLRIASMSRAGSKIAHDIYLVMRHMNSDKGNQ
jgi:hypothetical protein